MCSSEATAPSHGCEGSEGNQWKVGPLTETGQEAVEDTGEKL